jgi:hypothetical protein
MCPILIFTKLYYPMTPCIVSSHVFNECMVTLQMIHSFIHSSVHSLIIWHAISVKLSLRGTGLKIVIESKLESNLPQYSMIV